MSIEASSSTFLLFKTLGVKVIKLQPAQNELKKMSVQNLVAMILTCCKNSMECDTKVLLRNNFHLVSDFLKPTSQDGWLLVHKIQQKMP